jgi:flagellar protein FlaJ
MVNLVGLAPLGVAGVLVALVLAQGSNDRLEMLVSRVSRAFFGRYVEENSTRARNLERAFRDTTYITYAAKTYLYTVVATVVGVIVSVYAISGFLFILPDLVDFAKGLPTTIGTALGLYTFELVLTERQTLVILMAGGTIGGGLTAILTYLMRWEMPKSTGEVRRRSIDEGLARTVAFMYALSRGGMAFPSVMRVLAQHRRVYGETANEVTVAVREMDLFGQDMISALRRVAYRTPSDNFKTFTENLASVLQSGRQLSTFLRDQYERYQEEAEQRQEELLELLATIAEAYVTVLVAGTLFLITILLVFGLTTTDTLWLLQMLAYLLIPLANVGFVVYLGQKLESLGIARESGVSVLDEHQAETPTKSTPQRVAGQADGGHVRGATENLEQLSLYDTFSGLKGALRSPIQRVTWNPTLLLYLTVPIALGLALWRLPMALQNGFQVRIFDDILIQSLLIMLVPYAIVREVYKRRINRIEAAVPEFLERLASLNEAGMSVVESIDRVRGSDLGVLTPEVDRIWLDIQLGANVQDALIRFGRRMRTTATTRVVSLLTNAMEASGKLGPVLRIAGTQARSDLRMRRSRRQQMLTYQVVIYISFLVFLVIIVAIKEVLVPALPETVPTPDNAGELAVNVEQFARLGSVDKAAYTLVFFHTALVQSVASGFIAGQLGEGTIKDGAKHAAIMLIVAYGAFLVLSSPVASVDPGELGGGDQIQLESVSMSDGGFVLVRLHEQTGPVVGTSAYYGPGTHQDVTIEVDRSIPPDSTVIIVPYQDANGNEAFDITVDEPYPEQAAGGTPGIVVRTG